MADAEQKLGALPAHVPSYLTIEAEASRLPARRFCGVCGFASSYTCLLCRAPFCSVKCKLEHDETRCLKRVA